MTTSVTIRPAGHHVRVVEHQPPAEGAHPAQVHTLDPGTAERTFYVHSELSLTVEEFVPETATDEAVQADDADYRTPKEGGLPVAGYQPQSAATIDAVNRMKVLEERVLRALDELKEEEARNTKGHIIHLDSVDQRWLAIGRTDIERGFMAINRAIFQPRRIDLD